MGEFLGRPKPRLGRPAYNFAVQLYKDGPEHKIKQRTCVLHKCHKLRPKDVHQVQLGPPAVTNQRIRNQTDLRDNIQPSTNVSKQRMAEAS